MADAASAGGIKISVRWTRAADYRIHAATGAMIAVAPTGDLAIDFYVERQDLPPTSIRIVDNKMEDEGFGGPPRSVTREAQCAIVITPEVAERFAELIMKSIKQVRHLKGEPE
jgi:hypothetical protein